GTERMFDRLTSIPPAISVPVPSAQRGRDLEQLHRRSAAAPLDVAVHLGPEALHELLAVAGEPPRPEPVPAAAVACDHPSMPSPPPARIGPHVDLIRVRRLGLDDR